MHPDIVANKTHIVAIYIVFMLYMYIFNMKDEIHELKLNDEQENALALMMSKKNVFLSGAAGTGKTTVMKEFIKRFNGNCVVVAPTGVAAVNVGGQTMHSFFMLPPGLLTEDTVEPIKWRNAREKINRVDVVVIDEISMVRSDMFAAVDRRLRECAKGANRRKPFGGKQIIACGDFFQLPPVVSDKVEDDWLNENLGGEYAFETQLWKDACFESALLHEPFRQKEDHEFVSMLDNVRNGKTIVNDNGTNVDIITKLNSICALEDRKLEKFPVRLCTTNREAQAVNNEARAKIDAPEVKFQAVIKGKFNELDYPTEAELILKVGCRVMVLCNMHKPKEGFWYVNGDCGEVLDIIEDYEQSKVKVKFDNGNVCWISCREWKNMKYVLETDKFSGKKVIRQEEIGSFMQMPLRLAYATTIHKSQGMTLDSIDIHLGNGCFAHGQLYTALSRARSLKGLKLERKIENNDLILDERVVEFYKSLSRRPLDFLDEDNELISIPKEHVNAVKAMIAKLSAS